VEDFGERRVTDVVALTLSAGFILDLLVGDPP
jgi:hypothetical protein